MCLKCHQNLAIFLCSPAIWILFPGAFYVHRVECSVVSRQNYKNEVEII